VDILLANVDRRWERVEW
jgi:hypothetical protein